MNIYKLSRLDSADYDEYKGAIVVAETSESARLMHPNGCVEWMEELSCWYRPHPSGRIYTNDTWVNPHLVVVELIGKALDATPRVVLDSFKAG